MAGLWLAVEVPALAGATHESVADVLAFAGGENGATASSLSTPAATAAAALAIVVAVSAATVASTAAATAVIVIVSALGATPVSDVAAAASAIIALTFIAPAVAVFALSAPVAVRAAVSKIARPIAPDFLACIRCRFRCLPVVAVCIPSNTVLAPFFIFHLPFVQEWGGGLRSGAPHSQRTLARGRVSLEEVAIADSL